MESIGRQLGRVLRFIEDKTGVSAVEYSLIIVAVIAIIGVGAGILGGAFKSLFTDLSTDMSGAAVAVKNAATS